MRAHLGLPSVESEETEGRPPITVKFEIPYFTTSGIQVGLSCIEVTCGFEVTLCEVSMFWLFDDFAVCDESFEFSVAVTLCGF